MTYQRKRRGFGIGGLFSKVGMFSSTKKKKYFKIFALIFILRRHLRFQSVIIFQGCF